MEKFDHLATISIQGGGVFGLSLLGQLSGLLSTENPPRPVALAGSSAGAIITTLSWAGYSPAEILGEILQFVDNGAIETLLESEEASSGIKSKQISDLLKMLPDLEVLLPGIRGQDKIPGSKTLKRLYAWSVLFAKWHDISIVAESIGARGLFGAENFTKWLDELLRRKLVDSKLNLGIDTDATESRRPTFREFFDVDYGSEREIKPTRPLLLLVVASINRADFIAIDSHSESFQDLFISDVVRASIAFPAFFKPVELPIWRDLRTGEIADSETANLDSAYVSRELFVDGGVIANFPSWLVLDLARELMWGKNLAKKYVRLPPGVQFRPSGTLDDSQADTGGGPERQRPLRHWAFRPMVHYGLELQGDDDAADPRFQPLRRRYPGEHTSQSNKALEEPAAYWGSLGRLIAGSARSKLESRLLDYQIRLTRARFSTVRQSISETGWTYGPLAFDRLSVRLATQMFDSGTRTASNSVSARQFDVPSLDITMRSGLTAGERIRETLSNIQGRFVGKNTFDGDVKLYMSIFLLRDGERGPQLREIFRFSTECDLGPGAAIELSGRDSDYPEVECYERRRAMLFRRDAAWHNNTVRVDGGAKRENMALCYIEPITDNRERRNSFIGLINPDYYVNSGEGVESRDSNSPFLPVSSQKDGVIFGVIRVDILVDTLDDDSKLQEAWKAISMGPPMYEINELARLTEMLSGLWSEYFGFAASGGEGAAVMHSDALEHPLKLK